MGDIGHCGKVFFLFSDINIVTFDGYMEVGRRQDRRDEGGVSGKERCVKGDRRMRVEGISTGQAPALKTGAQTVDAISKSLQKQIENAQKQLQDLAKNDQMPPEDKMKKRQELQKQISDLNQQLRQHEIELRRKQTEEAREKREREAQKNECEKREKEQGSGLSKDSMNAMLTADSAVRQAGDTGRTVTRMKGEKSVLASEIRTDRSRGVDTAHKEEKLSDLEKRIDRAVGGQVKKLAEADKKLKDTAQKEYDERTKDKKAGDKDGRTEGKKSGTEGTRTGDAGAADIRMKDKKAGNPDTWTAEESGVFEKADTLAEEIEQKTKKEQEPGQRIDRRL